MSIPQPVRTTPTEVWFTNPNTPTRHGYIHRQLTSQTSGGATRYVVLADDGIMYVTDERYIELPTSPTILRAEEHINFVLQYLRVYAARTSWGTTCINRLEESLYELAKPEATDRSFES